MSRPRHWIVTVVHNALPLTKRALQSFAHQRHYLQQHELVPGEMRILVINNESSDTTVTYISSLVAQRFPVDLISIYPQKGVAHAWNTALRVIFDIDGADHALVVNNDVELRPDTYAGLLTAKRTGAGDGMFVTGIGDGDWQHVRTAEVDLGSRRPHPDFSCFLMDRRVWQVVGPFDENFHGAYGEDCDYHCRMHQAGIRATAVQLPFLHVDCGSGTLKAATELQAEEIRRRANENRQYFYMKWGFRIGSPEYAEFFKSAPERVARAVGVANP